MLITKQFLIAGLIVIACLNIYAQDSTIQISDDLKLIPLSQNFYIHVSYEDLQRSKHFPANGLIYIDNSKAYMIDTPWNNRITADLLHWLQDSLKVKVEVVVATHWHVDCMGGLDEIHQAGISSYASVHTCKLASEKGLPVPKNCFKDSMVFDSTSQPIHLIYVGKGHTSDNIVVWFPQEKILFGGCLVKGIQWKGLGYTADADLDEWPQTLKKLLEMFPHAKIVIPGHGDYGGLNLIQHTLSLF